VNKRGSILEKYNKTSLLFLVVLFVASSYVGYTFLSHRNSQKQLTVLRPDLTNVKTGVQTTNENMLSLQGDLKSLTDELSLAQENLKTTETRLSSLSNELRETKFDMGAALAKLDKTLAKLNHTKSDLRVSQTELDTEKDESDQLKARNGMLEDDFRQLTRNTVLKREVTWFDNFSPKNEWSYSLKINRTDYLTYVIRKHPFDIDYRLIDDFITPQDRNIENISEYLVNHYPEKLDQAEHVLAFVQSMSYEGDIDEYPKYPLETLVEGGGDCEDTSILYATIMKGLGYDVAILGFWDHVMVGVAFPDPVPESLSGTNSFIKNGKRYYSAETTDKKWRIGEILEDYEDVEPDIYPIGL